MLVVLALLVTAPVNDFKLTGVIAAYVVITLSYTMWLKYEPVIDLAMVAAGFVLRAIAGGVATGVPLSDWFLIVGQRGFTVHRHRQAPRRTGRARLRLAGAPPHPRRVLHRLPRLRARGRVGRDDHGLLPVGVRERGRDRHETWFRLSIVPFVILVLRYALVVDQGGGGAPEEVVLSDRVLQIVGLIWVITCAFGVHG